MNLHQELRFHLIFIKFLWKNDLNLLMTFSGRNRKEPDGRADGEGDFQQIEIQCSTKQFR